MSKNTERGMGHHTGPVADGRPDEMPRAASEHPAASSVPAERDESGPARPQRSEMAQVTLLGVSAPVFDREKLTVSGLTAPGRDVHLPVEARRAPMPRPIAGEGGSPVALPPRRRTPEPPVRTVVDPTPASTVRVSKTKINTPVTGSVSEPSRHEGRGAFPVGRREPDATGMVEGTRVSSGVGASVVLGVGLSVVLALIVVGVARFGPHVRTVDPLPQQRFEGRPDPRLDTPGLGRPARAGAENAASGATPDGAPAEAPGSTARAAPPGARTPPPVFDEIIDEARAANNLADKTVRRPTSRPRAVTSTGDRGAGWPGPGTPAAPYPRRSPGRAFDGQSGSASAAEGSGAAPNGFGPGPSPSPFQPPSIPSPRAPSSRGDESKAPYDPDSPLPPASE